MVSFQTEMDVVGRHKHSLRCINCGTELLELDLKLSGELNNPRCINCYRAYLDGLDNRENAVATFEVFCLVALGVFVGGCIGVVM